jgi:hypothetical protein
VLEELLASPIRIENKRITNPFRKESSAVAAISGKIDYFDTTKKESRFNGLPIIHGLLAGHTFGCGCHFTAYGHPLIGREAQKRSGEKSPLIDCHRKLCSYSNALQQGRGSAAPAYR